MCEFDIELVMNELKKERKVFASERDFQFELAFVIRKKYPKATVILEYCPDFDPNMHIDILVKIDGKWIPIELKYKNKGCKITVIEKKNEMEYNLKYHSCVCDIRYDYLEDVERIEKIKNNKKQMFEKGYAIFITNNSNFYEKSYPLNSLHEGNNISPANSKNYTKNKLNITGSYDMKWHTFYDGKDAVLEDTNDEKAKIFKCLISEIKK